MLQEQIPKALWDFQDVFAKTSFDSLPEHREWDHAIELVSDPKSPHPETVPAFARRAGRARQVLGRELILRTDLPVQVSARSTLLLHKKEGWIAPAGPGL